MTQPIDDKVRITRVFDAPRALVFQAFTDPDQVAQWFGPVGYSAPRDELVIEPRAGGRERIVMVRDDDPSERVQLESVYTQVVVTELVAGHSVGSGPGEGNFRFEFHDEPGGKTRLELTVWPLAGEPLAEEERAGLLEGWESSFTKLDRLLLASARP